MAPSLQQIFTDVNNDGWQESFREFLGYFVKQFIPVVQTQIEKLYFARLDYPLIVFPLYLGAIITLFLFWKKPTTKHALAAGVCAGFLFYFYFHYWVYWIIVIGLLFLTTLIWWRDDRKRIRAFLVLLGALTIVAIPYFINYFQYANSGQDLVLRFGIAEGREPGLATVGYSYLFYMSIATASYFLYRKTDKSKMALFLIFIAAMFIIWNIQVAIGYVPTPNNWRRTVSPILFIMVLSLIYDLLIKRYERQINIKRIVAATLIILTAAVILKKTVNVLAIWRGPEQRIINAHRFSKDITDSWEWLNKNLEDGPRLLSNSFMTSLYLSVYTAARPYLPMGILTPQSIGSIEERFLTTHKLLGTPADTLEKILKKELPTPCAQNNPQCPPNTEENIRKNIWHLYGHYFRRGGFTNYMFPSTDITDKYIVNLIDRYKNLRPSWKNVEADYVYIGPWEKQFIDNNPELEKNLELVYKNTSINIYKIQKR